MVEAEASVTINGETTQYATLAEAFTAAAAASEPTITVLKNKSGVNINYTATNTCTLDLNGHTLTGSGTKVLHINATGCDFTICDTQGGGALHSTSSSRALAATVYVTKGTVNLLGGTVSITSVATTTTEETCQSAIYLSSGTRLNMSNGTVNATRTAYGKYCYGVYCANGGAVTVEGGAIHASFTNEASGTYVFGVYVDGTSTIKDATITATGYHTVYGIATRITTSNTTLENVTCTATATHTTSRAIISRGTTLIKSGDFTATAGTEDAVAEYLSDGTTTITGGTFTAICNGTGGTARASGLYVKAGTRAILSNATFMGRLTGNATITDAANGDSQPNGAYGVLNIDGTQLSMTNCTATGECLNEYAFGVYTNKAATITGSTLTATTTNGKRAVALYVNGTEQTVNISKSTCTGTAGTTFGYGAYVYYGNLVAANTAFSVETKQKGATSPAGCSARGIYAADGTSVTLDGGSVSVTGTANSDNAYGLYLNGTGTIDDTEVVVSSVHIGYALVTDNAASDITVNSGMFNGQTDALNILSTGSTALRGGCYNTNTQLSTYAHAPYQVFATTAAEKAEAGSAYNYKVTEVSTLAELTLKDGVTTNITDQTDIDFTTFNTTYNGVEVDEVTYHRHFTVGNWSTICLPFDVTSDDLDFNGLTHQVYRFNYAQGNAQIGGGMELHFARTNTLQAGQGYLVKTTGERGSEFVFHNVTINTDADTQTNIQNLTGTNNGTGTITFVGVLRNGVLPQGDTHFMGLKDNKIYYPGVDTKVPAYRAFFKDSAPASVMPRYRIVVEDEHATPLEVFEMDGDGTAYPTDSQEVRKVVRDGHFYILRQGSAYNAQGQILQTTR